MAGSGHVEKLLPQNVEAEAGVLGSLLIDPEAIVQVVDWLRPADFYSEAHRVIYSAAVDLYAAHEPADLLTLCDELGRRGKLEEVGGASYVSSLANQVPTSRNVVHYAQIVERTAVLRGLIHLAERVAGVAYSEPDADAACDMVAQWSLEATQRHSRAGEDGMTVAELADLLRADLLERIERDELPGVRTGLRDLDRHIVTVRPGDYVLLSGRPSSGKSALGLEIAGNVAAMHGPVDYFTLEMTPLDQLERMLAGEAHLNTRYIASGFRESPRAQPDTDDYHTAHEALERLVARTGGRLRFHKGPLSVAQLRSKLIRAVRTRGSVAAFVDQIDLMSDRGKDETQRIQAMSRELKQIAMAVGIPIFCLVQLNRDVEHRRNRRPMLSDLKQSGQLEQDADLVLGIYRPAYYEPQSKEPKLQQLLELGVLKARRAPIGMVPLRFEAEYTRVTNWDLGELPSDPTRGASD